MLKLRLLFAVVLLLLITNTAYAQDGDDPTPTPPIAPPFYTMTVVVKATDDWILVGDLYLLDTARPTILLLHQLYTDRHSWEPVVIPALLAGGYNALAVDVRGHGQTGGAINWDMAISDVQVWLDWMRANSLGNGFVMGSSMGSALALVGCGNDPLCRGAIAVSPGWDYYGISVEQTFKALLGERPVLIIYATTDPWPAYGVPMMVEAATGEVTVLDYPGNMHGMDLFTTEDTLIPSLWEWLHIHAG
jgi:pimeloyl-ACP methyl ester carboxylesterase